MYVSDILECHNNIKISSLERYSFVLVFFLSVSSVREGAVDFEGLIIGVEKRECDSQVFCFLYPYSCFNNTHSRENKFYVQSWSEVVS